MNRRIMVPKPSLFTGVTVSGWEQVIAMLTMCNYSRCLKGADVLHCMFKFLCEAFQFLHMRTYCGANHIPRLAAFLMSHQVKQEINTNCDSQPEMTEWSICPERFKNIPAMSNFSPAGNEMLRVLPRVISWTRFLCLSWHHKDSILCTALRLYMTFSIVSIHTFPLNLVWI